MKYQQPISSVAALAAACLGLLSLPACGDDSNPLETVSAGPTGATQPSSGDPSGAPTSATTDDPTEGPGTDTEDPTGGPQDGPHALGTIFLGESHPAAGGDTLPAVTANFIPDAANGATTACTENVAGCQIALVPECAGGCAADEYCTFDDACDSVCQPICDAACGDGEVCYFPAPGTPGCKPLESFDAGALTFIGTPLPITLFPPYVFMNDAKASPFAASGSAQVQASGATHAGFEAFEKEFTGTEFLQTSPKLGTIGLTEVYGDGPLPVRWIAGKDEVTITATVTTTDFTVRTVTCPADDASGSFDLPRAALDAAADGEEMTGLTLSVQRQRVDLYTDLTTKGELSDSTVQPVGHLRIVTSSSEYHAFQGCAPGESVCGDTCFDLQSDHDNCGDCGEACGAGDTCENGTCTGFDACYACVEQISASTCKAPVDACQANPACVSLEDCLYDCEVDEDCFAMCYDEADEVDGQAVDLSTDQWICFCEEACGAECSLFC
ncbi:hypothetical protein [Nannocystis radixulma]|uniref:SMB domain-containing protein n=1 Tax=Nannocystis radixulma TaxID=2995305 RepID=A0ABT5BDS0_9BACT|nr:hypothetical protein [Nannocystis radixulma]MDC0672283.1 hypothetical protein [Nannocystis radixulma]